MELALLGLMFAIIVVFIFVPLFRTPPAQSDD